MGIIGLKPVKTDIFVNVFIYLPQNPGLSGSCKSHIVGGGAYDAPQKLLQKAGRPGGRPLHSKVETAR